MKVTSSSPARRSAALARSQSGGSPQIPGPVIRIAPNPTRFTVRSPPTSILPAASAVGLPLIDAPSVETAQPGLREVADGQPLLTSFLVFPAAGARASFVRVVPPGVTQ